MSENTADDHEAVDNDARTPGREKKGKNGN
jgi:hypothetical protein